MVSGQGLPHQLEVSAKSQPQLDVSDKSQPSQLDVSNDSQPIHWTLLPSPCLQVSRLPHDLVAHPIPDNTIV